MKESLSSRTLQARGLALLLALLMACPAWLLATVSAPQLPDPGNVPISKADQEKLGLKVVGQVYQQMPILPDSDPITQYVQQLGKRLQTVIPQQYSWPYQFHVVQQKEINAFALPGGPIFINVGTITSAANEAQLAGVIAHEMAHVYMQHSIKGALQQQKYGALAGILGALGQAIGGVGGAVTQIGGQLGAGVLSMKYSRKDEAQADEVGAIIMYKAGYDPRQMAQFFETLAKQGGGGGPQFLSDHPNPGNRYQAVSNQVKNWPSQQLRKDSPQFAQTRQRAQTVKVYTAEQIAQMAKSGQIHNTGVPAGVPTGGAGTMENVSASDVMPSGSFKPLNAQAFTIEYPSNWQPSQEQQGGGVTIAPAAGASEGAVAYGVVINGAQPQANSFDDAVNQIVSGLTQQNPGLRATGSHDITVNGIQAKSVDLLGQSPLGSGGKPLPEHDWLVAMPFQQNAIVYLVFISPERDFSKLRPTFEHMLKTFRLNQG